MLAWGEKGPNRAERIPTPRATMWPDPSRSSALPVGKRASASTAKLVRSDCVTLTLTRTAISPTPVADPATERDVVNCGLLGVPPKKCAASDSANEMICASLVPTREVDTIGSATPMSTRSSSPKLMKNDVTVMSMSSASRNAITSFSSRGTPYGAQLLPSMLSQAGELTFWWTKFKRMSSRLTPRSVAKCRRFMFAPTNTRPPPSVWARSANTGPGETDVRTGAPPSKRNVEPPLVALTGMPATFPLMALLMKEIRMPFCVLADVRKWLACTPVPPRKRGCWPGANTKSSEILSRSPCAAAGADTSANPKTLHTNRRMDPPWPRREAAGPWASSRLWRWRGGHAGGGLDQPLLCLTQPLGRVVALPLLLIDRG